MNVGSGPDRPLVVFGAGGQGRVAAEAAALAGWRVLGFLDDAHPRGNAEGHILATDDPRLSGAWFHVGIGNNTARLAVTQRLLQASKRITTIVHPSACVSPAAQLGGGVFAGPLAIIHTGAAIGDGAIINSAAVVEHDCRVGAFVHVAPGAVLGGDVHVEELALVGLGARVLPGVNIGARAVVGAGAVVTHNVTRGTTVIGVPARPNQT